MNETHHSEFQHRKRSTWVRLRTLVILRWIAIFGQLAAIMVAVLVYDLQLRFELALLVVGSSLVANLYSSFLFPQNHRLTERQATLMLLFDIIQLAFLLYLTGGIDNPFMLLILAPVTIAATVLDRNNVIVVLVITLAAISFLSQISLPILDASGSLLELPELFGFGFWVALMIGVIFLAGYARRVTTEMHVMGDALLATQLALSREQKLTDLGGVVAATAHELGTPLATIKLISSELLEEVEDNKELFDDVSLIREQADRCREILQSMGRAGKDDKHLRMAPIEALVREAAEPHTSRGKTILFDVAPESDTSLGQPIVQRQPEIIHGLRNLIQNAVDFANERVGIDITWTDATVQVRIADDGMGIPSSVIGRIGDPFVRRRRANQDKIDRPSYDGMGLGLFIAKTLLERSSAELHFSNGDQTTDPDQTGAIVNVWWRRSAIELGKGELGSALGENKLNLP